MQQTFPPFGEMPEQSRSFIKASLEQAQRAFDMFLTSGQRAMQSFDSSTGGQTPDGLRRLNEKIAEFTRANADANFRFALGIADCRQFSEIVELQSNHMRQQLEIYGRQLEELRGLSTDAAQESAARAGIKVPGQP